MPAPHLNPFALLGGDLAGTLPAPRLALGANRAAGALLYIDSSGNLAALPIGTSTHVLTVASGLPAWAAASGGGGGGALQTAYQAADLVVTSNAAYQDTDLKFTGLATGIYIVECETWIRSHATPGALLQMAFSGTVGWATTKRHGGQTGVTSGPAVTLSLPAATSNQNYTDEGTHRWSATMDVTATGDLAMQFRQNTSSANSVTFRRGSYLMLRGPI